MKLVEGVSLAVSVTKEAVESIAYLERDTGITEADIVVVVENRI
jgi:hypothetical protein